MAVSTATELKILVKTAGDKNLDRLSRQLDQIGKNTVQADFKFDKFSRSLQRQERQATKNISNMRAFAASWRELANSVDITSKEFRQATAEAQRLERQIAKTTGAGAKGKGAGALGAIGAAGFLGPEQLLGAGVGALFGAPLAGAAVASMTISPAKQVAAGMAETVAEINRYRIALAGVSKDQEEYAKSVQSIEQYTKQFLLPLTDTTAQYTRLQASVVGAGMSSKETDIAFKGVAAAITATGGTAEDLNSALVATSQVFSKGKVSAEELRQQIGERLPGAFTIFAESMGKTPQELDKALEKGEVTLEDFIVFATELFNRYGKTSEIMADAPENAGKRLKVTLDSVNEEFGGLFQKIGAYFQDFQTGILNLALVNADTLKEVVNDWLNAAELIIKILDKLNQKFFGFAKFVLSIAFPVLNAIKPLIELSKLIDIPGGKTVEERFGLKKPTDFGSGLGKVDFGNGAGGGEDEKKAKKMKQISEEIYQLELKRIEATKQQNALLVYQLDFEIKRQQLTEQLQAKLISQRIFDVELRKAGIKLAEGAAKVEDDIEKKLQKQIDFRVAAEAKIQDALFKTQNLSEEERKRIDINRALSSVIEEAMKAGIEDMGELLDIINRLRDAMESGGDGKKSFKDAFKDGIESMGNLAENLGSSLANAFGGASDALADFITTGKANFREFAQSVLQDLARIFMRYAMFQAVKGIFNLNFSANGNVMTKDGPMPLKKYANGGIAKSPQLSIFGEGSTPEAYVPLPDGRSIPVTLKGSAGGGGDVIVNVDAKGSSVEGDKKQSKLLGAAIGAAVQAELIKQKKPGGLLY